MYDKYVIVSVTSANSISPKYRKLKYRKQKTQYLHTETIYSNFKQIHMINIIIMSAIIGYGSSFRALYSTGYHHCHRI